MEEKKEYGGAFTGAQIDEAIRKVLNAENTVYEFGDGLSKDKNTISVTTPVRGIFTQEEFDALPEEQRNRGLSVILDGEGGGGSSGGTSVWEVYSTEETRIGTWIDGKPLYRRVFIINTGSLINESLKTDILVPAMDPEMYSLKKLSGTVFGLNGAVIPIPISYVGREPTGGSHLIFKNGNFVLTYTYDNEKNGETDIFAEYTKTSDEGGAV